jgi:hypothetical protein
MEPAMKRSILALVAAFVAWAAVATVLNFGLRVGLEGYAAAEPRMSFTLAMMVARLVIGASASLVAGAVAGRIAPAGSRTPWVFAAAMLALFIPGHIRLWQHFPVWYHLTFLVTLVPLIVVGSRLWKAGAAADASNDA